MAKKKYPHFESRKPNGPLTVKVGDTVAFARYFLQCIGEGPTSDLWRARGKVTGLLGGKGELSTWPYILWEGEDEPRLVNPSNLAFPGANLRFCELLFRLSQCMGMVEHIAVRYVMSVTFTNGINEDLFNIRWNNTHWGVTLQGCCLPKGHWKPTHKAHPLCKWAENQVHAQWVLEYGLALCREYTTRYGGKIHKTEAYLRKLNLSSLPVGSWDGFLQVIPEEFKDPGNPVGAYRNYYRGPRISAFATWKNQNPPEWWTGG